MADNLIFPIGFDLESGVQDAIKKGDVALRQIQAAMNRKPIVLRAEVDANKFQMFSRQFTSSIDGISAKLAQAQRVWNSMSFDVKFDSDGNLSRRAQVVFDAFQQLTQASATMGQRLGEVNRNLAKSEQDTARAITAEYDKRRRQTDEQIRLKERQAAAEERVRQGQLKGVNAGYVDTQRQVEAVRNLRLQYEAILPMLNAMAQRRYDIKVGIDKQFEADIQRINAEIARLLQSNLQLGAKGDTNAIQANLQAIRQLEAELQRISQQKIDLLNSNKINSDLARLRTEISSVFGELQSAERRLASDNSLNAALDAQSQKVVRLHADIQKLDQQFAQLNATGKAYNQDGSFTAQANTLLQQRIALTKQLEQEAITGQQAQIKLEQQLREEKHQTEQAAKQAAKEAERQAKAEAAARKQAQDAANAENKARQEVYNARRRQGQETQRILNKEAKSIADITAKLQIQQQRLQSANIGSAKFNKIAEEVRRLTADLEKANQKMRELTGLTQSGAARQSAAVKQVSQEFKNQETYVSRLIKRMAVYASFSYVGNFLTSIREVTAQFELQRVSLGAIIQDQTRANALFSEIKAFALKSPVSILDLTKYTKQIAAYRIETEKLFDTTKMLTDISVGLGVDLQRITLFFGQVRARGALFSSEIRQATEAGIPLVELLAKKYSELNGQLVTASQVLKMVEKGMVGFEMVEEIFKDMTSAGGMFYEMQEKQGNTLFGLWAKLGDAASVMYDQIGNTDSVNNAMKAAIGLLTEFMRNWKAVGAALSIDAVGAGIYLIGKKAIQKGASIEAEKVTAATRNRAKAQAELNVQLKTGTQADIAAAQAALDKAKSDEQAAIAANKNIATIGKLKTGLLSLGKSLVTNLGIGLVISLASTLVYKIFEAWQNATRLKNTLSDIRIETGVEISHMVTNFESLAKKAVEAADGSREQKDALSELKRTYRNIIPEQNLEIDKLREMNGEYSNLTIAIREYVREQQLQKGLNTIIEDYSSKIVKETKKLKDKLGSYMFTSEDGKFFKLGENQIDRIVEEFKRLVTEGKSAQEALKGAFELESLDNSIKDYTDFAAKFGLITKAYTKEHYDRKTGFYSIIEHAESFSGLTKLIIEQNDAIEKWEKQMDRTVPGLGNLTKFLDEAKKTISEFNFKNEKNTFAFDVENAKVQIDTYLKALQDALNFANVNIDLNKYITIDPKGIKHFDFKSFNEVLLDVDSEFRTRLQKLSGEVQNVYYGFIPSDRTVASLRNKLEQLSGQTGASMDVMRRYLMKDGESWADYSKRIEDEIKSYEDSLTGMKKANKAAESGKNPVLEPYSKDEINKTNTEMNTLISLLDYLKKTNIEDNSDQRFGILKEMASTLKQVNKEYEELAKKEGAIKALTDTQDKYANTFKYLQSLVTEYNFELPDFGVPTDAASLAKYLDAIKEAMKKLPKSEKAVLSGETDIADINMADAQKKIESELKRLADRISRTKTAKEFYEKILGMTGDVELAANLSLSIYGENGEDLDKAIRDNIQATLGKNKQGIELDFSAAIRADGSVNYNALTKIAKGYLDMGEISEETYNKILKMRDEDRKDLAKTVEGWLKATERAKTYSDKLLDLRRKTQTEIDSINEKERRGDITPEFAESQRAGFLRKEAEEIAKLQYEAFKDSPMYVQMFDELDNASTTMLRNMKSRMESLQDEWKNLDPTQLKEMQSRMKEIDEQLVKRNPFSTLAKAIRDYRKLSKEGDSRENKSAKDADADLMAASKAAEEARKKYDELVKKYGEGSEKSVQEVIDAKDELDKAMSNEKAAQKAVENWKKVKDMIRLSANELSQMLNWAGDITKGIADISEAMGADEEDVQYWNDMSNAIGQISGGIQDIVSAAMSGDVVGIISSVITAIPKMFVGITKLFHIGKIRKANKEIKRQQELLEQLEYTYGRLEKAAERLFGKEYLENYNQQLEVLRAQAEAYRKQAEAEERKGKEKDKEKIKENEEAARETADKIQELQDDLFNRITGTDVASAARDFAQSWLDAYLSFGSTTDAIKEKFQEMVKNMLVESYLAKTVQNALMPVFDMIDERTEDGELSEKDLVDIVQKYNDTEKKLDDGLRVKMEVLKKLGFDIESLRNKDGSYTGIAKNIAGATSEEINTAAAIGNTLMYYVSPIPRMDENLAAIRALMERGISSEIPSTAAASAGWTDWQKQAMDNYIAIQRNTAETVTECRRIAERCTAMASDIHKVIVPRGVKGSHGVQIYM